MLTHEQTLTDVMRSTIAELIRAQVIYQAATTTCRPDEQDCAVEEMESAIERAQDALDSYRMAQVLRRHRRIPA
jgi:hypothetical protein